MTDDGFTRFVEQSQNKLWGKYRGIVHDRDDPEQLGRLKLRVPSLLGDAVTGWAWPVSPYAGAGYGFFMVPQVDDLVWVEFAEGELEHPLWTGAGWAKPGGQSEVPEEARGSYPDVQVIRTRAGNVIVLDDTSGAEKIVIRAKSSCQVVIEGATVLVRDPDGDTQELATKAFVTEVFDKHTHPSGVGPTGMPVPKSTDVTAPVLTSVLKAK